MQTTSDPVWEHRHVVLWLGLVTLMVFVMITVGGITRLTDSGLSMVEWRPLMGMLPPLTDAEWGRVFDLYRQSPEYQKINAGQGQHPVNFYHLPAMQGQHK